MKKFGAMVMALVLACSLAGCAASSKLPVNGFEAQKRNEESWFIVQGEDFIEELNAKGKKAGYPQLALVDYSDSGWKQDYQYGISSDDLGWIDLIVTPTEGGKYDDPVGGNIIGISVYTNVWEEEQAEIVGFYLDQIVGMFSPRDKDEIEEKLAMFDTVQYVKDDYINGNVIYKRETYGVIIYVNEEEAELLILDEDKTPPPHLKKPE